MSMRWTLALQGAPKRVNHAAAAVGDFIYSFGGYCTGEDYNQKRPIDVHMFNTNTLDWSLVTYLDESKGSDVPFQRYGHTVVSYKENIILWGGRNDEGACNIVYVYDVHTNVWLKPTVTGTLPRSRDGHSATVVNSSMYIFGGFEDDTERFSQDIFRLDLITMNWTFVSTQGKPPKWRDFHSASCLGDKLYIFGGRSDQEGMFHTRREEYDNQLICFDVLKSTWHHIETSNHPPLGRRSHSSFVFDGKLYIFGGYNGIKDQHFNDLHQYNPVNNLWVQLEVQGVNRPCPRRRQSCCIVNEKLYLFGGTSPIIGLDDRRVFYYNQDSRLQDQSDLYVLDFRPTLRTLCLFAVCQQKLEMKCMPSSIQNELEIIYEQLTQKKLPVIV